MSEINEDGTITLSKKYSPLWNLLRHANGKPYSYIFRPYDYTLSIPKPKKVKTGVLIELPENYQSTLDFGKTVRNISIYKLNLHKSRLEICCSEKSDIFLRNVKIKERVILPVDARTILISSEEEIEVNVSFSVPEVLFFPFNGIEKCRRKGRALDGVAVSCVSQLTRNTFIETIMPDFAALQYYMNRTLDITAINDRFLLESNSEFTVNYSGKMEFDSETMTFISLTDGEYKAARDFTGNYLGFLLPNRRCVVTVSTSISIEGKKPKLTLFLKYKVSPGIYYNHEDVNGSECRSAIEEDSTRTWVLNEKYNSNVILYIEVENFSFDDSNFDDYGYTIKIE